MHKPISALDRATKLLAETPVDAGLLSQLHDENTMVAEPNFNLTVFANLDEYKLYKHTGRFFQKTSMSEAELNALLEKFIQKLSNATDPSDRALQHTFLRLLVTGVKNGSFTAAEEYTWGRCTTMLLYLSGRYWQSQATDPTVFVSESAQELQRRAHSYFELLSDEKFAPAKFSLGQIFINEFLKKVDKTGLALYQLLKGIRHIMAGNNDAAARFVFSQVPVNYLIEAMVLSVSQNMKVEIQALRALLVVARYLGTPETMYFRAMLSHRLETKLAEKVKVAQNGEWLPMLSGVDTFMEFVLAHNKQLRLLVAAVQSAKDESIVTESIKLLEQYAGSASSHNQHASYHLFTIYYLGVPPFITPDETKALGYLRQNSATSFSSTTTASSVNSEPFKLRILSLLAKDLQQQRTELDAAVQLRKLNEQTERLMSDPNGKWKTIYKLFLFACQQDFSQQTYATKQIMTDLARAIPALGATITGQAIPSVTQPVSWSFDQDKETSFPKNFGSAWPENILIINRRLESALQSPADLNAWLILCEEEEEKILLNFDRSDECTRRLHYVKGFSLVLQGYAAEHGIHREKNLGTARQLYTQAQTEYSNIHAAALLASLQLKEHPVASPEYKQTVAELMKLEKQNAIPVLQLALGKAHCTPAFYQQAGLFQRTATLEKGINYFCQALNNAYYLSSEETAVQTLFTAVPLDKLVDYLFTAAKLITADLQKNIKSPDWNYADAAFNCVIAKALKYAAESDLPAATYCRAEVSRLVIAHLGRNSARVLGNDTKNGYLLIDDTDIINALLDVAGKANTSELANAALTSLDAYQREGKINVETRYKIFLLHIGIGCVAKNPQKALECIQEGVVLKSLHPELLNLLVEELLSLISALTEWQPESAKLVGQTVYQDLYRNKAEQLKLLFDFIQKQDFSKCTAEIKKSIEKITSSAPTLIEYYTVTMQKETQLFLSLAQQGSSSSSTSSATTLTTSAQTPAYVQQVGDAVVGTYSTSPVAPATTNSSFTPVQSIANAANVTTTPTGAPSL